MTMEWPSEWDSARLGDSKSASETDARERHKLAERERRKSMRELFLNLHALLPHASTVRKEQSAILDEIVKYIPLAVARLRSLQSRRDLPAQKQRHASEGAPAVHVSVPNSDSSNSGDCYIRVAPEPTSSVSIRVRGDRVNVSLTDTKATSQAVLLSAVLDELGMHQLELVRSTHCRDGAKLLHHSESKVRPSISLSLSPSVTCDIREYPEWCSSFSGPGKRWIGSITGFAKGEIAGSCLQTAQATEIFFPQENIWPNQLI
ncbi:bHLH transcriptional factor [Cinnamomum micranthum f. kanehirae]|uniref:BHLH transcriptional factor n=1 Tax=Cinnamomum micranthum f. kanehirae TaxID=337451 RepID=A0A3S3NWR0_9MAGN|nr:bHLH transcriptional factor [Cinnamomum micranthum f. kanehirae]